ncbi:MAG: phage terminase large subunit [Oscillospiraceae bacterium]|nr:phage terminase large subunit [Oscillospiraceae bacterium]
MSGEALIFKHLREEVPNPRQQEFFKAQARHIGYGGARGGGKSWAARRKAVMLCMRYDNLKGLLLRRTMPELRNNHIIPLQMELNGYARYKNEERAFLFPNGSRLSLGYCDSDGDLLQYQGQEFDFILFEEATHFPEDWILFITTSLRTTRTDFKPRVYYTTNPGGVGHEYFKRIFIDRRFRENERPEDYLFIPATVYDNKVLMEANPEYVEILKALPEHKRKAHLDGCWDLYEGQIFEEFRNDPSHYDDRCWTHVIQPFDIPQGWRICRSFDFGYSKPFSCAWWAVDYDGRLYRILELYGCVANEPDVGVKWSPEEIFTEIARIEREHPWLKGKHIYGVADPAIWDASRGVSIAETAEKYGIYFDPGDHARLPGWMQVHYRLRFDDNGIPMLYVFSNCKAFIRTMPLLLYDANRPEDIDTKQEDHVADEVRYLCMANPIQPVISTVCGQKVYNPLEEETAHDAYAFYRRY